MLLNDIRGNCVKIRIQKPGLVQSEIIEDLRNVVILDDFGNPLFIAQQHDANTIISAKASDRGFEKLLNTLGIGLNKTYKVTSL